MERPVSTSTIGRTVVVAGYVVALALAGRPAWLAVLLGVVLVLVWVAPLVLAPPRRSSAAGRSSSPVEPTEGTPG